MKEANTGGIFKEVSATDNWVQFCWKSSKRQCRTCLLGLPLQRQRAAPLALPVCYMETKKKLSSSNAGRECWGAVGGPPASSAAPRTAHQWLNLARGDRTSLPSGDHTVVIMEGPTASSIWERPVSPATPCGTKVRSCGVSVGQNISGLGFTPVSPSLQGNVILG